MAQPKKPVGGDPAYVSGLMEVDYAGPTALTYRESGGTVVIEAEHYAGALPGTQTALGDVWQETTYYTGYSGDGAMQGGIDDGSNTSPRPHIARRLPMSPRRPRLL